MRKEDDIMPKLNEIVGEEAYKAIPDGVRNKYKDIDFVDSTGYVEKSELDTANKTIKQYKKSNSFYERSNSFKSRIKCF